jgi:hypothetical protein
MLSRTITHLLWNLAPRAINPGSLSHTAATGPAATAVLESQGLLCGQHSSIFLQFSVGSLMKRQQMHATACIAAGAATSAQLPRHYVQLDRLHPAPGSSKLVGKHEQPLCLLQM